MDVVSGNSGHDNNVGYNDDRSGDDASIQKRNAASSILDFTYEEWESCKALKEADAAERSQAAMANEIDDIIGALGTENETPGALLTRERCK